MKLRIYGKDKLELFDLGQEVLENPTLDATKTNYAENKERFLAIRTKAIILQAAQDGFLMYEGETFPPTGFTFDILTGVLAEIVEPDSTL